MAENNPIKYSDLIKPDTSLDELISKLEKLDETFKKTSASLKNDALQVSASLKGVSGATEEGRKAIAKASEQTEKLAQETKKLAKAESENSIELIRAKREKAEQLKQLKLEEKLLSSAEGSYNRLSAQYAINKARLQAMSKAERENAEATEKLVSKTNELYQEMKKLQEATGQYQLNVGNYTNAIQQALGANSQFGSSIIGLAQNGNGFKGILIGLKDGALAFGKALVGLMANPAFAVIAGVTAVGGAMKFWYDYNKGIAEATRLTKEFTGKSGDDLVNLRSQIEAVADTYGKNFKEVLSATDALASQFGGDFEKALKAIQKGFSAGADLNGDMLNKLSQYAPLFKDMGMSSEELVATIAQTRSGIFSDAGMDAIRMASTKIKDMQKATSESLNSIGIDAEEMKKKLASGEENVFQAIQRISKELAKLPSQSQEVGAVITDVFGKKGAIAGQELIKSLAEMSVDLDVIIEQTGEWGKLNNELTDTQAELNKEIASLFEFSFSVEDVWTKIKIIWNDALISLIRYVKEISNKWMMFANANIKTFYNFKLLFAELTNAVKSFSDLAIKTITNVTSAGKAMLNFDVTGAKKQFSEITDYYRKTTEDLQTKNKLALEKTTKEYERNRFKLFGEENTAELTENGTKIGQVNKTSNSSKKEIGEEELRALKETQSNMLELRRKYEDELINLIEDEQEKQLKKVRVGYERRIEDLKLSMESEKNYTKESRQIINSTIIALEKEKENEINSLITKFNQDGLKKEENNINERLKLVEKGTQEERDLLLKRNEIQRQVMLSSTTDRQLTNQIFDKQAEEIADSYINSQIGIFDAQQKLAKSEFELLQTTEAEKTRFRINSEIERWKKVLELNEQMAKKMSDDEVKIVMNTIKKLENELSAVNEKSNNDIYSVLGLKISDDDKKTIEQGAGYLTSIINDIADMKVQASQRAVSSAEKEVDSAKKALETEMTARANGFANNVEMAQKELAEAEKNQEKARKQEERALKEQQALQAIEQSTNLITATAKIWGQAGSPIKALPLIALMWSSFAISKIKASQVTKYKKGGVELLEGGSHESGNDVHIGTKDGRELRAEGGEFFAVINKKNSRKYRSEIPNIINSLNNGNFEKIYGKCFSTENAMSVNINSSADFGTITSDVEKIRKSNETKVVVSATGEKTIIYKNLMRVIK